MIVLEEMRRQVINDIGDGASETGRRHLVVPVDGDLEFEGNFELQKAYPNGMALREGGMSFRTPNIEREVSFSFFPKDISRRVNLTNSAGVW